MLTRRGAWRNTPNTNGTLNTNCLRANYLSIGIHGAVGANPLYIPKTSGNGCGSKEPYHARFLGFWMSKKIKGKRRKMFTWTTFRI